MDEEVSAVQFKREIKPEWTTLPRAQPVLKPSCVTRPIKIRSNMA